MSKTDELKEDKHSHRSLQGKVIIVTGAAQGLGRNTALYLARQGATIVAMDRQPVEAILAEITAIGGTSLGVRVDVSDATEVEDTFKAAIAEFGRIDVLINGAALFTTLEHQSFFDIDPDEWDRVFAVNTKSVFLCSRAAARQMIVQRSGSIINIASNVVSYGMANLLHYVSSKAAVIGITRSTARELGEFSIRVNAVSPGFVTTEITAAYRSEEYRRGVVATQCIEEPIQPDDISAVLSFLASDESHLITGQTLIVNGGSHMGPA
jgi:3-oxoacyl-[acyl-carrier protein] reductase